ncbi:MAG: S-layer homology domain-containing protein [Clostridia bacterium]|nr:S-layer homology domain-containing protein [Clostridia bacterium]
MLRKSALFRQLQAAKTRKAVILGVILLVVVSLAGAMAVTGATPASGSDLAVVTSDPALIAIEPTVDGPFTLPDGSVINLVGYADGNCRIGPNGELLFDFTRGAGGGSFGFQPGSCYEFDMLFRIYNKVDREVYVNIAAEDMGACRDYLFIGSQHSTSLAKDFTPGEPDSYPWPAELPAMEPDKEPDRERYKEIAPGDFIWVSIHFDIPAEAALTEVSGKLIISAWAKLEDDDNGDNGGDDNGHYDGGGSDNGGPPVANVPQGAFIARWPGHIPLVEGALKLEEPQDTFTIPLTVDSDILIKAKALGLEPRVYIWNEKYEKWVALASYPQSDGTVKAINDGGYTGWTAVFAVRQPRFLDLHPGDWYEPVLNRANGMALLEGFAAANGAAGELERLAKPQAIMTRAEFVAMVTRALGLVVEGEQKMYNILRPVAAGSATAVLARCYFDADQVPTWCRQAIATAFNSGLLDGVEGMEYDFCSDLPISRLQAAVIISNALQKIPGNGARTVDLNNFADFNQESSWANGKVVEGVLAGDADGSLRPNDALTRAEAYTLFMRLLRQLGW